MARNTQLGDLERRVLTAILELDNQAFANTLTGQVTVAGGKPISRGALYTTLDRLEGKGYLTWKTEATTPARGGLPRRAFTVTKKGLAILRQVKQELTDALQELDAVLDRR
jgi:PadR family transcriptional regulator PadR